MASKGFSVGIGWYAELRTRSLFARQAELVYVPGPNPIEGVG